MNKTILNQFWNEQTNLYIDILTYVCEGEAIVFNDSWHNDECPSAIVKFIEGREFKIFFPSDFEGDYSDFAIFEQDEIDFDKHNHIGNFNTIGDVCAFLREVLCDYIIKKY